MAKIHVRGGSALKLKFQDDLGRDLMDCQLNRIANGWYTVRRTGKKPQASGPALQAVKERKSSTVFRSCGESIKKMEIGYSDTRRP